MWLLFSVPSIFFITSFGENQETRKEVYQKVWCMCRDFFFFFCLWNLSVFYSYLLSRCAATYSQPLLQKQSFLSIMTTTKSCSFTQDKNTNKAAITKATWGFLDISEGEQGAKKIIFTACHSSKLKLASTSPDVISNSPKSF